MKPAIARGIKIDHSRILRILLATAILSVILGLYMQEGTASAVRGGGHYGIPPPPPPTPGPE